MNNKFFTFENLEVWKISLEIIDSVYDLIDILPSEEKYNLVSQMRRASTSISLNIAEGSTMSSNKEKIKYLKTAIRSSVEVTACLRLIQRRKYINQGNDIVIILEDLLHKVFAKLNAFVVSIEKKYD